MRLLPVEYCFGTYSTTRVLVQALRSMIREPLSFVFAGLEPRTRHVLGELVLVLVLVLVQVPGMQCHV